MFDKFYTLQEIIIDAYEFNAPIEIEKGFLLLDKTSRDILLKLTYYELRSAKFHQFR